MHTITTLMYLDLTIRNIWAVVCFSIEIVDFMLSRGAVVGFFPGVGIGDIQEKMCHISVSYVGLAYCA
ncbi:TPA_asm: hypothetical protein G2692_11810 [Salmonella enterica subsp. enterica serovar Enteritidis str. P125109]|nr:hypothetical protein [Salmonella enterica subsp. enterica serovar Enteritidis str. P125109]